MIPLKVHKKGHGLFGKDTVELRMEIRIDVHEERLRDHPAEIKNGTRERFLVEAKALIDDTDFANVVVEEDDDA